ncbi:MAG: hypothetical protein RJQ08_15725 [Salinisphaeraceae bacterium]
MSDLTAHAERIKLARVLGLAPAELDYLEDRDGQALRDFRESLSDALFNRYRARFEGMAKLSSLLPLAANARLSELVLGPTLSARIAGELPVKRAVALGDRLPVAFLAEVSRELDPRRAADVVAAMPPKRVVAVALALLAEDDFITMGRFLDSLSESALAATIEAIDSDAALLRIGFFAEDTGRLSDIVRLMPTARRRGTVVAAAEQDCWPEALSLMLHLDADLQAEFGQFIFDDATLLAGAVAAVAEHGAWPVLVRLATHQDDAAQARLAEHIAGRGAGDHDQLTAAAEAEGVADALAPYAAAYRKQRS